MTVASFFSGIGGFDLGFERAGYRVAYQCEIEPFCGQVLAKHWPAVPRQTDIRGIDDTATIPPAQVWCAGFPCQDVPLAFRFVRPGL